MKNGKSFARAGDFSDHNGSVMPPSCSLNVFINKRGAATKRSMHVCPKVIKSNPPIPHAVGPVITAGVANVLINGLPAIGEGDRFLCAGGAAPPAKMKKGSPNVVFGARSQAQKETSAPVGGHVIDNDANTDSKDAGRNNKNADKTKNGLSPLDKAGIAVAAADVAVTALKGLSNNDNDYKKDTNNSGKAGSDSKPPQEGPVGGDEDRQDKNRQYGQARADAAKKVIDQYQSNGTVYSQAKRTFGLDAVYADCSSTTMTALCEAGQGAIFKEEWTGGGSGGGIQGEIRKIAKAGGTTEPYRIDDPLAGDIMMWSGHIAIVTEVADERVKWANMGNSGPKFGSAKLSAVETDAEKWSKNFWGFWTPPDPVIEKIIV